MHRLRYVLILLFAALLFGEMNAAQKKEIPRPITVEDLMPAQGAGTGSSPSLSTSLNPKAATDAYLAKVAPDQKARSDAYFEGGYWLLLWNFLYTFVVLWYLLQSGLSARLRSAAERVTRFKALQIFLYWTQYILVTSVLLFPLTVYARYFREHKYGLSTQTFGAWMGDFLKGSGVGIVLGSILLITVFSIIRRMGARWWLWGALITIVYYMIIQLIAPVFILPIFNKYTKLTDEKIREPILSMARANGISAKDVYQVDASRQSTRVSANVSGFLGTERITLNDNLIKRCSLPEIKAVMGHEMGHYVLNHVYKGLFFFSLLFMLAFAFLDRGLKWGLQRWGSRWELRGLDDPAVLPLAGLLILVLFFFIRPIIHTYIRTAEYEADIFGLNASREADGFAEVALKLGEYRKLDPGPVEEWIFFDHPSGRTRIYSAMRWKAENSH